MPAIRRRLKAGLARLGLLRAARLVRGLGAPTFVPAKPHLLVAVNKGLQLAMQYGTAAGGDYLEFGIYKGFTLWYAQAVARDAGIPDMRFFGFDSFSGLPAIQGEDENGPFFEGDFACSKDAVHSFLEMCRTDWTRTFLVEGWFDKTLTSETCREFQIRKVSVCVIDCDLYESAQCVLRFLEPVVQDKTILIFDDWSDFGSGSEKGEPKAFAEFLQRNRHIRAEPFSVTGYDGKGFVLRVETCSA
jgi:O-methyltransferase